MSYNVILKPGFEDDIKRHLKAGNKKLVLKVSQFLNEISEHPRTGTGQDMKMQLHVYTMMSRM